MVQHSRLAKYSTGAREQGARGAIDALAVQKIEEIRLALSSFQRRFALAAVAPRTEREALEQIELFCPQVAAHEEIVLVLNPLYNDRRSEAEALLVRMQYMFVKTETRVLRASEATRLLGDKFGDAGEEDGPAKKLIGAFAGREVHLFHLSKVAADREARALFTRAGAVLEDHLYASTVVTEASGPLLPACLPFLFLFMDSAAMLEGGMELLYGRSLAAYSASGEGLRSLGSESMAKPVLETALCTTAGESVLRVVFDGEGRIVPRAELTLAQQYSHCRLSGHLRGDWFKLPSGARWREAAQLELMLASDASGDTCIAFVAEGAESHRLYEIRIHQSPHTLGALAALGPCPPEGTSVFEEES